MTSPDQAQTGTDARIAFPLSLTLLRVALAPVLVIGALLAPSAALFGACLVAGLLSDVFDGIVARRLGVAVPALRRLDSIADTLFYLAAGFAAWILHPQIFAEFRVGIIVLLSLESLRYAVDFAKFGREASYHMWSAKLWGLTLFFAFLFLLDVCGWKASVPAAIYVGIVADCEGLLISLILPQWINDVPTLVHALRLRHVAAKDER